MTQVRLGFMGFGEVGYGFARDLIRAGLAGVVAYSPAAARAGGGTLAHQRAADAGVELVATPGELAKRAELIVAVVPGAEALPALRTLRRHLGARHLYVDASTASVRDMERAAAMLEGRAGFVDAAVMGTVPLNGMRVVTVASGPRAAEFHDALAPLGMNIKVVPGAAGAASAMKLLRSVVFKGLTAVLIESLEAARRLGVMDEVAADICGSIDERPFAQTMKRLVCGTAVHAERRVHEMHEAMTLLRHLDSSTRLTAATKANLVDIAGMGLREAFGAQEPEALGPVLDAVIAARGKGKG